MSHPHPEAAGTFLLQEIINIFLGVRGRLVMQFILFMAFAVVLEVNITLGFLICVYMLCSF